ncbi:MAG: hypothetical protein WCI34_04770, partial [Actinomycetes bacterium]
MAQLVNYNRILQTPTRRADVIQALVPSIQAADRGYVVTTDWRTWVRVDQTTTDKRPWIIAAFMFIFLDFFFFWTGSKQSVLGIDMDETVNGTTLRITGMCSHELAQHIEAFVGHQAQLAPSGQPADPSSHIQISAGAGAYNIVHAGPTQTAQPAAAVGASPLVPVEEAQSVRTRAACTRCDCQDFEPSATQGVCSCGHDAALVHGLMCPPPKPSGATEWASLRIDLDRILVCGGLDGG